MKVRLLRNIGGRPDLKEGAEADIDDSEAEKLIRRGLAEKLPTAKAETVVEAVPESDIETVPPRRRKRKAKHNG